MVKTPEEATGFATNLEILKRQSTTGLDAYMNKTPEQEEKRGTDDDSETFSAVRVAELKSKVQKLTPSDVLNDKSGMSIEEMQEVIVVSEAL